MKSQPLCCHEKTKRKGARSQGKFPGSSLKEHGKRRQQFPQVVSGDGSSAIALEAQRSLVQDARAARFRVSQVNGSHKHPGSVDIVYVFLACKGGRCRSSKRSRRSTQTERRPLPVGSSGFGTEVSTSVRPCLACFRASKGQHGYLKGHPELTKKKKAASN